MGLIGLGRVGSQVAKIGKAFGMEVMAWSENLSLDKCKELGVLPCSKEDLIQNSDFLSVHVHEHEQIENLSFELNPLCYKVKRLTLYIYLNLSFRSKP